MAIDLPGGGLSTLRTRPTTLCISHDRTVLIMCADGSIVPESHVGLFVCNTRLLSRYRYLVDGRPPRPVVLSNVEQQSWLGYFISPSPEGGEASQQTIELRLSRFAGDGFHEDVNLTNFTQERVSLTLTLEIDADFADQRETSGDRRQQGTLRRSSRSIDGAAELRLDYRAEHAFDHQSEVGVATFEAGVVVRVRSAGSPSFDENGRIHFRIDLAPHATWHACVDVIALMDRERPPIVPGCGAFFNARDGARSAFERRATSISAPGVGTLTHTVVSTLERAKRDLLALRLYDLDRDESTWTVIAGVPIYVGFFGRDTLATGAQAALLTGDILAGTIAELPLRQGTKVDDWRDEQPGRMLHQAFDGPLSKLNYDPFARSYASVTSTAFYPSAVSELWRWTGDRGRVGPLIEPALKAIRWLDEYGDLDGDGFIEYEPRSSDPIRNQGWKDSGDAIVHADGSQVHPPIGTCEMQGFAFMAKIRMAELLFWFGRKREALDLYRQAVELQNRFNEVFWMPDAHYIAMGLGPRKQLIRSIASDPGLCLATGVVDRAHAQPVAARLLAADMFSGWGVRTLSSDHPAYDPYSYHRGSVWPVGQGALALGLARYGLHEHVASLSRGLFEAAALFEHHRLPECFSGHARDREHPFPALYPDANSPQAWSSASVFALLQAMLGIYPYAPLDLLLLDPALPDWLPDLTVSNLHVGRGVVSVRFARDREGKTQFRVLEKRGTLHVVRQASPWSLVAGPIDRLRDALSSLRR